MNVHLKPTPPEDIRPKWFSVVRAIQAQVSRSNNKGVAVVSINIVIDASGDPVVWTEPNILKIHPQHSAQEIIAMISKTL